MAKYCPAAVVGLFALISASGISQTATQDMYIANARVLDVGTRTESTRNVLIRNGKLASFPASKPAEFTGPTIDAGGRWLMPAFSDMHVHSVGNFTPPAGFATMGPEAVARVVLYGGIARYLDLFSSEDVIFAARATRSRSATPGADIFAAGPCLTASKGHCSEYGVPTRIVNSPADAQREVNELAAKKPDVVKVVYDHDNGNMPTIDRPTLAAVVTAAKANGLKTVVHIGTWEDLRHAVLAGAAAVTHTPAGELPTDIAQLMVEHDTLHIPTLAVQSDYSRFADDPSLLDSPLLASMVDVKVVSLYKQPPPSPGLAAYVNRQRANRDANAVAVRKLAAAGVIMVTGTDGGNPGIFQGYSLHRELRLLVQAGLSPWEALAATSTNAGRLLGRRWGMNVGDEASFVMLDASPLADIRNTERIHRVVLRGVMVDRDALRRGEP